ncbi:MAG TPA: hypothetical protein VMV49_03510 [Candidatus Deferrimicrobium sp.]|nr:hypothetical protein [Candidatus Deferrimicrobium sp.]
MIIIRVEKVEDFVSFLNRRLGNEIFYEFNESSAEIGTNVILYYLAKIDVINVVYQVELFFPKVRDKELIKKKLDEFEFGDIRLIPGKIREIYMSIS